jgi:hypothetical protein
MNVGVLMRSDSFARGSPPTWGVAFLLGLFAVVLVVADMPPDHTDASRQPQLSKAVVPVATCVAPPDHAILPVLPRWNAHMRLKVQKLPHPGDECVNQRLRNSTHTHTGAVEFPCLISSHESMPTSSGKR